MTAISAPSDVLALLELLEQAGYPSYLVGGAVRSQLMGQHPNDFDVCTAACPDDVRRLCTGFRILNTGLQHGTVTALLESGPVEITTFRTEGTYTDGRRPDSVSFVSDIRSDLARRDFTINAMAWSPRHGLLDPFGGQEDLARGILRCVGNPTERLTEDALRILRALRFAASYGLQIEPQAHQAILHCRSFLHQISAERITAELVQILCSPYVGRILIAYAEVISEILPELRPMIGFDQNNPHHRYTLWEHSVRAVEAIPPRPVLRLTMLFHDVGKSVCYTEDDAGVGHFYGHATHSVPLTESALRRLRLDHALTEDILYLVRHHDTPLGQTLPSVRRKLAVHGERYFRALLAIHKADCIGQGTNLDNLTLLLQSESLFEEILKDEGRLKRRNLAVNGQDLISWGVRGREIGDILAALLNYVLDDPSRNTPEQLYQKFLLLQRERDHLAFTVSGMSWKHCVQDVRRILEHLSCIQYVDVDLPSGRVEVVGTQVSLDEIRRALADAGYKVAI